MSDDVVIMFFVKTNFQLFTRLMNFDTKISTLCVKFDVYKLISLFD